MAQVTFADGIDLTWPAKLVPSNLKLLEVTWSNFICIELKEGLSFCSKMNEPTMLSPEAVRCIGDENLETRPAKPLLQTGHFQNSSNYMVQFRIRCIGQ